MTTSVAAPQTSSHPTVVALVVPSVPPDAVSGWRRLIQGVDGGARGAFALTGQRLNPGTAYEMPPDALIVTCDTYSGHRAVRLLRADSGDPAEIKAWDLKAPLGKRVVDYVARRLPEGAAGHRVVALEVLPNKWKGFCARCHNPVDAHSGLYSAATGVVHRDGECLPPPPRRNLYPGECARCEGWIEVKAGILVHDPEPLAGDPAYRVVHDGQCPPRPAPAPVRVNDYDGWCRQCGTLVEAYAGRFERGTCHLGPCPPAPEYPTWRVYRRPGEAALIPGRAALVRVSLGDGWGAAVPVDAPGFRVLAEDWFEFAAVVLETVRNGSGRRSARVRAASFSEAEEILARQARDIADAAPDGGGFKAVFSREKIGPHATARVEWLADGSRPWLAEITGRDRFYGYERRFLAARRDFENANRRGTRGVVYHWTLQVDRIYEAQYPESRRQVRRVFLRATPEGDVEEITGRQVEAFLNGAAVWIAA